MSGKTSPELASFKVLFLGQIGRMGVKERQHARLPLVNSPSFLGTYVSSESPYRALTAGRKWAARAGQVITLTVAGRASSPGSRNLACATPCCRASGKSTALWRHVPLFRPHPIARPVYLSRLSLLPDAVPDVTLGEPSNSGRLSLFGRELEPGCVSMRGKGSCLPIRPEYLS